MELQGRSANPLAFVMLRDKVFVVVKKQKVR